jgi:nitrogen regulatory protein P-II 1
MKRVEAFFQFGKLEPVVEAVEKAGVGGLTVFYARGRGTAERTKIHTSRGTRLEEQSYNLIDCIVTVVEDDRVDEVVDAIKKNANSTSKGIITISDVTHVVKI